jgi:hypothetical protein
MPLLVQLIAAFAVIVAVWFGGKWWLINTLSGRRMKRSLGYNTRVRGKAHAGTAAVAGGGASQSDARNG